jgi:hypothetical protein
MGVDLTVTVSKSARLSSHFLPKMRANDGDNPLNLKILSFGGIPAAERRRPGDIN